jgi:hypothetical protein
MIAEMWDGRGCKAGGPWQCTGGYGSRAGIWGRRYKAMITRRLGCLWGQKNGDCGSCYNCHANSVAEEEPVRFGDGGVEPCRKAED